MASVEEHIVKITQQVQGGSAANGALAKLEAQTRAEERALAGLGVKADAARVKLADMMEGRGGKVDLSAIDKQRAAIAAIEKQMASSKAGIGALGDAKGMAAEIDASAAAQKRKTAADREGAAAAAALSKANRDASASAAAEQRANIAKMAKDQSDNARRSVADEKAAALAKSTASKLNQDASKRATAEQKANLAKMAKDQSDNGKIITDAQKRAKGAADQAKRDSAAKAAAAAQEKAALTESLGPLGGLVNKLGSASAMSGAAVSAALVLIGVLLAVATAAVASAMALTRYALASADAARSQRLFDNAAAGSVARGSELNKVVSQIASGVPIAREEVAAFGRQLELAGISGARMQTALAAISMIESVVPGAGAKIEGLVERFQKLRRAVLTKADLEGTGLALVDVAAQLAKSMNITQAAAVQMLQNGTAGVDKALEAMRAAIEQKFGKTIAGQMLSLTVQASKLKENIAALFTGIDLEPLLAGLKSITDLFSQNTVTGRVLKQIMSSAFQTMIDKMAVLAPIARTVFIQTLIAALKLYIALRPIAMALAKIAQNTNLLTGLAILLGLIALPFVVIGVAVAGVIVIIGMFVAAVAAMVGLVATGLVMLANAAANSLNAIKGFFNLGSTGNAAGGSLGDGVVLGIQAKIADVVAAVSSMGAAAEQALRNALGWHSPATLGVDAAVAVGEGVEVGAGKAEGGASEAIGNVVNPKGAKDAAKAAKGGGKIIYIEKLVIGSRDDLTAFRASLLGEFEFHGQT